MIITSDGMLGVYVHKGRPERTSRAVTVLGGRAYAMVPGSAPGTIDIVEPGGRSCGSLTVADGYTIGGDGSLLYVNPEGRDRNTGRCTVTYYPQVLK